MTFFSYCLSGWILFEHTYGLSFIESFKCLEHTNDVCKIAIYHYVWGYQDGFTYSELKFI